MARRSALASAIIMLTVTSCGGGGGDDPDPTPTPTATPTPTPTPTTPIFPLAATREFATVSAVMSFTGDITGPITLGAPALDAFADRVRIALQNTVSASATTETVVRELTEESRFTGADLRVAPAPAVTEYEFAETTPPATAGAFTELELLNNSISGSVTSDSALALSYVSYLGWYRGESTAGAKRSTYAIFGLPTAIAEVPTTGTTTYTMRLASKYVIARAAAAGTYGDLAGTVTTTINYATGAVAINLVLTRGGAAYASYTGTGSIASGSNRITGSLVSTAGGGTGSFQGGVFGPAVAELGLTFVISGVAADGGTSNAVGVLVGKKN